MFEDVESLDEIAEKKREKKLKKRKKARNTRSQDGKKKKISEGVILIDEDYNAGKLF